MALQVWLPLNGNLNNCGVGNYVFTNSNATSSTNGKVGSCYSFNGSNSYLLNNNSIITNTTYTLTFWAYTSTNSHNQCFICSRTAVGFGLSLFLIGSAFRIDPGGDTWTTSYSFPLNTWVHVAVTCNSSTNKVAYFINGQKQAESTFTLSNSDFSSYLTIGASQANNGNYSNYLEGRLNDVRIYDNVLSDDEIKKISQGLTIHYPLNREGFGQDNNINPSKVVNRSCTSFAYDSSTRTWTMVCPVSTSTWGVGFYINDTSIKWGVCQTWVVSLEVYVPQSISWNSDINNKPDLEDVSSYTGNDYDLTSQRLAYTNGEAVRTLQSGWNKVWYSQTAGTSYGLYNYSTNFGIVTSSLSNPITVQVRNIKGEIIDAGLPIKPTPWIPNINDALYSKLQVGNGVVNDVSGFLHHGTIVGTPIYSSDTSNHNVSLAFDENADSVTVKPFLSSGQTIDAMSCSIWFKTNTLNGTYPNLVSLGENSFFRFRLVSASSIQYYIRVGTTQCGSTFSCKTLTDNTWHHIAVVFDKGYCHVYLDGLLIGTGNHTATATYMTCSSVGTTWHLAGYTANSENFLGKLSDFRIYVTALSADDVSKLYNKEI